MKVAIPLKSADGLEAEVLGSFERAPYFAVVEKSGDEVKVNLFENPSSSPSELAQVLLSYGVKGVLYSEAKPLVKSAFEQLGIEVLEGEFKTLKEAIYSLF
ncbi:NifB/NifX family molybdenum-iron cluster-binding protein [Thermovibrio sp.]